MGEGVKSSFLGEAYLDGLVITVQFLIEDLNDNSGDIRLISNRKDMVNWVNGCEATCWDNRFLRNRVWNRRWLFEGIQVVYKQDSEFMGKKIGKLLLKSKRADEYNGMRSLAAGTHDESSNTL
ncbi:hypothetical protein PIB30_027163, partial [Stylosanthes scabra]|nr:hypothetical protein [Stylosanthes scabra]